MVVYQSNGTSQTESFTYNTLGQLTRAQGRGADTSYDYSATANDGRITSRTDNLSGEEVTYKYDELGRLAEAATAGPEWGLSWRYDGFGNRLEQNVTKGTPRTASFAVDPATNRLTGGGFAYDANGNMLNLGTGSGTARYDVDNRMVWVSTNNGIETYGYSAANQRIQVTRPNGTVETFFYGLGGELLGVYQRGTKANEHYYFSSASIRVRFAGRLIDGPGGSMVTDRLGSVVKNGSETLSYYPYGELKSGNTSGDREKFATYTRDAVSGLDYAWNRYYSSESGRFTSADPYRASGGATEPQSWNRYSYVLNNPAVFRDSSGLYIDEYPGICDYYPDERTCNPYPNIATPTKHIMPDAPQPKEVSPVIVSRGIAKALSGLSKISKGDFKSRQKCREFFAELIRQNGLNISPDVLMNQVMEAAAGANSGGYVYDGPSSSTALDSEKFPEGASGDIDTVGEWFGYDANRDALSQKNGLAIFIRQDAWSPSVLGDGKYLYDGQVGSYGLGTLLHELLHKSAVGGGFPHTGEMSMESALAAIGAITTGLYRNTVSLSLGAICF